MPIFRSVRLETLLGKVLLFHSLIYICMYVGLYKLQILKFEAKVNNLQNHFTKIITIGKSTIFCIFADINFFEK